MSLRYRAMKGTVFPSARSLAAAAMRRLSRPNALAMQPACAQTAPGTTTMTSHDLPPPPPPAGAFGPPFGQHRLNCGQARSEPGRTMAKLGRHGPDLAHPGQILPKFGPNPAHDLVEIAGKRANFGRTRLTSAKIGPKLAQIR